MKDQVAAEKPFYLQLSHYAIDAQKAALLWELSQKLRKNAINKEKHRLDLKNQSWRDCSSQNEGEGNGEAKWVDLTAQQVLQQTACA